MKGFHSVCLPFLSWLILDLIVLVIAQPDMACTCPPPPNVAGYSVTRCPEGWVRYKLEKCFKIFHDKKRNFQDAKTTCKEHDSLLASVHSEEENKFISSYLSVELPDNIMTVYYLGGIKKGSSWIWADHSQFEWSNWLPGHPSAAVGICTRVHRGDQMFQKMTSVNCVDASYGEGILYQKYQTDAKRINQYY